MKSITKGRGRISNLPPLRRPGQPVNSPDYILTMLALSESDDEVDLVDYVIGQVAAACSSPTASEEVVNIIFRMSINDRRFGKVGADVLARLVLLDHKCAKNAILNKLQAAFKDREKMNSDYGTELVNFVYFLGIFFNLTVTCTGRTPVCEPEHLITCLGMLLVPSQYMVQLFTEQMMLYGHKLLHHCPESLAKLMVQARKLVMGQADLGSVEKMCISLCIDLEAHNFSSLPDHLLTLYMSCLPSNLTTIKKELPSLRRKGPHTGTLTKTFEEKRLNLLANRKWSNVNQYAGF